MKNKKEAARTLLYIIALIYTIKNYIILIVFIIFVIFGIFLSVVLFKDVLSPVKPDHCKSHSWVKHATNPDNPEESSYLKCEKCGFTVY